MSLYPAESQLSADETGAGEALLEPADPEPGKGRGVRPSKRAALVLAALAVVSVAARLPVAVTGLAAAVLVGAVLVDMAVARRRPPTWARTRPTVLARGVPVPFRLSAATTQSHPVRLRQPSPPSLHLSPSEAPGGLLTSLLEGRHRGLHDLPAAIVRVAGPLGLATCDHRGAAPTPVTVFPDLPRARRLAESRRRSRLAEEGKAFNRLGLGTELDSIRDYSPDDDIRQVNWLATARAGRPQSNQYRIDQNRELLCVVDTGRLMLSPVGTATRLDVALDAVAVLAVAADQADDRVGALAFADEVLRVLAPRRRGAEAVVRALLDLEPVEVESDYERVFQTIGGGKRSLVVLFTDIVDPAAARSLVEAVPVLAKRHAVIVASSIDPDLEEVMASEPHTPTDVFRASAAAELLVARRRAAALIRAGGAEIVEGNPLSLGPAVVAAYVRLKERSRI